MNALTAEGKVGTIGRLPYYCVAEPLGEVYSVGRWIGDSYRKAFMNSSVNQFAEFLLMHVRYLHYVDSGIIEASLSNAEVDISHALNAYVANLSYELRMCDPLACAEADYFLRTGETFSEDRLPTREWTETLVNIERTGHWY